MKIAEIETSFYEDLRCAICHEYLVIFPIRACLDGRIICGQCEPESVETPQPYNLPILEDIMKKAKFLCKYKAEGCDEEFALEYVPRHELRCAYRSCKCPSEDCRWSGLLVDLHSHFMHAHTVCFDKIEIPTNWRNGLYNVLMTTVQEVPFVVEYKYSKDAEVVHYKISYISTYVQQASYQLCQNGQQIARGESYSYEPTVPIVFSIFDELKIENLIDSVILVKITLSKYPWAILNFKLLQGLTCSKCNGYLLPFAYNNQPTGVICATCAETSNTHAISKYPVSEAIKTATFPCKWKPCTFVSNAAIMFKHQKTTCRYKLFTCNFDLKNRGVATRCDKHGNILFMENHLKQHHLFTFLEQEERVVINFNKRLQIFAVRSGTFVVASIERFDIRPEIRLEVTTLGGSGSNKFSGYFRFEHGHCATKTKWFCISDRCILKMQELPPCFDMFNTFDAIIRIY